jgi:CubicO group peptidase (beta-lactamase class C family)
LPAFAVEIGTAESLEVPIPAGNGCFTARSLARMYAALAGGGELDGVRLLGPETIRRASEVQNTRPDLVIAFPMSWRLGYHGVLTSAGVLEAGFGHNGLGGSGAWADPDRGLAIAYVLNALGSALAGDMRFVGLGGAAVRCADVVAA